MAWTDVATGDKVEADHINDIHQALNGTVGKAQPMAFTEVDEVATYALDVRNKDATNSLIARFRNAANEVVLSIVKEAVNTAKQFISTVADGTAPFVVNSTTKVDNLNADTVDGSHASAFAPTSHQDATTGVHGVGASTVESAAGAQAKVDAHANLTNPHSATSAATANRLMLRDASGRSKVASPSAADDIARKDTVDAVSSALNTHKSSADHDGRYAPIANGVTNGNSHNHVGGDGAQIDHGGLAGRGDDDHTQYYNSARHTKAVHDALNIDADTLDGSHASAFAAAANGVTNGNSHDHAGGDGAQIGKAGMQPNSVDDSIVGDRVPAFIRRQGGNSSDWSLPGANTYTPSMVRMEGGATSITITSGSDNARATITFPQAFSNKPLPPFLSWFVSQGSSDIICTFEALSASSFKIRAANPLGSVSGDHIVWISWLAIGPE